MNNGASTFTRLSPAKRIETRRDSFQDSLRILRVRSPQPATILFGSSSRFTYIVSFLSFFFFSDASNILSWFYRWLSRFNIFPQLISIFSPKRTSSKFNIAILLGEGGGGEKESWGFSKANFKPLRGFWIFFEMAFDSLLRLFERKIIYRGSDARGRAAPTTAAVISKSYRTTKSTRARRPNPPTSGD